MLKLRLSVSFFVFILTLFCHVTADDQDGSASLLYCDMEIHNFSLASHQYSTLISQSRYITSRPRIVDYHVKSKVLFWTDYGARINKAPLWQKGARPSVLTGLSGTFGLAVDWIHDLIYWTYASGHRIATARLDGSMMKTILEEEGTEPWAIALIPAEGLMFWSDQGNIRKIECCSMDGSNRKVIVEDDILDAESLAIDLDSRRIFWVDSSKNYLSSSQFDGNNRRNLLTQLKAPVSLDVYGPYAYFVTFVFGHEAVYRASKKDGSGLTKVFHGKNSLRSLKVFDPSKQSEGFNVCGDNNGGCSHLCLPTSVHTFSCACPDDLTVRSNNLTCINSYGSTVTTLRLTTHPSSSQLPVTDFQTNFTSNTEENSNKNVGATVASSSAHAIFAVVIASVAIIAMVGMLLHCTLFSRKRPVDTGIINPVYNKNADENVTISFIDNSNNIL